MVQWQDRDQSHLIPIQRRILESDNILNPDTAVQKNETDGGEFEFILDQDDVRPMHQIWNEVVLEQRNPTSSITPVRKMYCLLLTSNRGTGTTRGGATTSRSMAKRHPQNFSE